MPDLLQSLPMFGIFVGWKEIPVPVAAQSRFSPVEERGRTLIDFSILRSQIVRNFVVLRQFMQMYEFLKNSAALPSNLPALLEIRVLWGHWLDWRLNVLDFWHFGVDLKTLQLLRVVGRCGSKRGQKRVVNMDRLVVGVP